MSQLSLPFWEELYQKDNLYAFSPQPNPTVVKFEPYLSAGSKILEVGAGEGQNALYLARHGQYRVSAFDLSTNAIAKLKRKAQQQNVCVNCFPADLTTYEFVASYDMVLCFGTLHFVSKENWKQFIIRAKDHTNTGGIHIMQIFTDKVPASDDIAPYAIGLAKEGEIQELYSDWEILEFSSHVFEDEHPNVPKHLHASNKIVARKPTLIK